MSREQRNYIILIAQRCLCKININFKKIYKQHRKNRLIFRRVIEKFEVGIEKVNHDAVETSKNLKVSLKRSARSASDTTTPW